MENANLQCPKCDAKLQDSGYFCGLCLAQFKCKECESFLVPNSTGCITCGAPKVENHRQSNGAAFNTFKLQETERGRILEASFSNEVGKELTGVLRDVYANIQTPYDNPANRGSLNDSFAASAQMFIEPQAPDTIPKKHAPAGQEAGDTDEYPALKAIAIKRLPGSESEWVLVYSFYASNYGKETFTRRDIIQKYEESNRKTKEKLNGLSYCFITLVKNGSINPLADGNYSILDKGISAAKEIINRTTSSPLRTKSKPGKTAEAGREEENKTTSKNRKNAGDKGLKRLTDIDFSPKEQESLSEFYRKFTIRSAYESNLLFVYYLQDILKINGITYNHIFSCYDALNLKIPAAFHQAVRNTKSATGWVETQDSSNIVVTVKGRNKIRFWDKD